VTRRGAGTFDATTTMRKMPRVLVRTAVLTLPSGAVRDRYRSEHLAELCALPGDHQIRYGLGALTSSWTLRRALIEEWDVTSSPSQFGKPMLCRLNLRHHWKWQYNPTGERYRRCTRCGKDDMGDPPRATKEHRLPPMPLG
jgi:hypothetical protein